MSELVNRVLIVEDEDDLRFLLVSELTGRGLAADGASTAEEALDLLESGGDWDLIITDLSLPGMSGEELIDRLGREHPNVSLVTMTADPSLDSAKAAVRAGVCEYLEMPFEDTEEVATRIVGVLRQRAEQIENAHLTVELEEMNRELEQQKELLARKVNVTQRNLREQLRTLRKSREIFYTDLSRVMAILDNLVDGIVFTDPHGKVILINPASGEMLGIPAFTALGQQIDRVEGNRALLSLLATHRVMDLTETGAEAEIATTSEGKDAHYAVHTTQICDFQGNVSGVLSTIRDISIRKKTEHLKNQFLSIVAHELRTPLTAIKAFATILDKGIYGELPEAQCSIVENILSQSDRLGHEIDKIISLGRLESSDFAPDLELIPAAEVLKKLVTPFAAEATEKGIELSVIDETYGARFNANARDIRRAIRALMENALKFTPNDGAVTLRLIADEEDIIFEVTDTGIGIAPENHEVIFDTFMQLENPLTRQHGGSGLGLCFVAEILKAHGTSVEVESELGEGATFRFRLPRVPDESAGNFATVPKAVDKEPASTERQLP